MHVAQIVAITASLIGVIVGLVYYLQIKSGDASYLSSSTWTISIPDESVTQTWYIDTDADVLKIVQHKDEQAALAIQEYEFHSGKMYEYTMWDKVDSTVPASACDGVDLTGTDCDSFVAEIQAGLDGSNEKGDCTVEEITDIVSLKSFSRSVDMKKDTAVVGGFTVKFTNDEGEGVPIGYILDGEDGSVVANIDSIVDGIAGDVTFDGCIVAESRRTEEEEISERRLGWQETLSNTDWCGAGTDNLNTPCPNVRTRGSEKDNHCCRRHDHGVKHEPAGPGVKLECGVDKHLADCTNNWAVQAAFGYWGVAQFWGCSNYVNKNKCKTRWFMKKSCNYVEWETKYGPWRYDNINNRGAAQYKSKPSQTTKTCPGDLF